MKRASLPPEVRERLWRGYPKNHGYRLGRDGRLVPRWRLARRFRRVARLLPRPLESLLDVGCSRGFFVLQAAREGAARALGIDVDEGDLAAARAVAHALDLDAARFEGWWLDETRARIDALGGPFQTTLCLNVYPYLFLGSGRSERHLADHDALFELLRELTGERLLFSARLSLSDCPRNVRERAARLGLEAAYDEAAIRAAAERRFEVNEAGRLGRIPLWVLDTR